MRNLQRRHGYVDGSGRRVAPEEALWQAMQVSCRLAGM